MEKIPSALALVTALVTVLPEKQIPSRCCKNGWSELVGGQCYFANGTNAISWRQANHSCRAMNAALAYPANNSEQLLLQNYISSQWGHQTVHIGLYYDHVEKRWRSADSVRSVEKPNSDNIRAGNWCSSLVPYPWYEKTAFIMQIVDCDDVRAPFICQTRGCMNAQCDIPPCDNSPKWSLSIILRTLQPNIIKSTTAYPPKNDLQTNLFGPAKTSISATKISVPSSSKSTTAKTNSLKASVNTTRTIQSQPPTSFPSAGNRNIIHKCLLSISIAQYLLQQFMFNDCLHLYDMNKAMLH